MASAPRKCLVCNYKCSTTEGKEKYQEVSVCPKCNGAFVDLYHIRKYMNKDWRPNKEVQKQQRNKRVQELIKGFSIDLDLATDDKASLLVIELEDMNSVPIVKYKGEEIKLKQNVFFDWKGEAEESYGGAEFEIEHHLKEGEGIGHFNTIKKVSTFKD